MIRFQEKKMHVGFSRLVINKASKTLHNGMACRSLVDYDLRVKLTGDFPTNVHGMHDNATFRQIHSMVFILGN